MPGRCLPWNPDVCQSNNFISSDENNHGDIIILLAEWNILLSRLSFSYKFCLLPFTSLFLSVQYTNIFLSLFILFLLSSISSHFSFTLIVCLSHSFLIYLSLSPSLCMFPSLCIPSVISVSVSSTRCLSLSPIL